MKNIIKLFGIIALIAIIGFTMAACGGNDDPGSDPNNPNGPDGPSAPKPLTSAQEVLDYLNSAEGGATADDPVYLPVEIDLDDMRNNGGGGNKWPPILSVIKTADKYVDLDLSGCTMLDSSSFFANPYSDSYNVAKTKIVSLVLPDGALRLANGTDGGAYVPTFAGFTALRSVSGKMMDQLNIRAFMYLTALESASFPNLKTINGSTSVDNYVGGTGTQRYGAFLGCTALKTVSFPSAETIQQNAFRGCTALENLDLPNAETIDRGAFYGCTNLQSISLPKAKELAGEVFYQCTMLKSITLGATPPTLGNGILGGTTTPRTITVYIPAGASGAYTTGWQDQFKSVTTNITIEVVEE